MCDAEKHTSGSLRVGSNNLTAVNRCPGSLKVPMNAHHSDILRFIRRLLYDLPIKVELLHVYSHQDDDDDYSELSRDVQLNVCCDINAKAFLRDQIQRGIQQPPSLPDERCVVLMGEVGTTSDVGYTL